MNRRELLKKTGVTALAGCFLSGTRSGGDTLPSTFENLLLLRFLGPFTFELNANGENDICATPPPVGPGFTDAPHQPWVGTTSYERSLDDPSLTSLRLSMNFTSPRTTTAQPPTGGIPLASFPRPTPAPTGSVSPLYSLWLPAPDRIVGIQSVLISFGTCDSGSTNGLQQVASGAIFTYHNVDITTVLLSVVDSQSLSQPIQPPVDFSIDTAEFPGASLDFHLTANYQVPDDQHLHACAVVKQMKAMLSWIPDINLNPPVASIAGDDCKAPVLFY